MANINKNSAITGKNEKQGCNKVTTTLYTDFWWHSLKRLKILLKIADACTLFY